MKKYLLPILLLLVVVRTFSQSTNISTLLHQKEKKGDYFFDQFAYRNALEIYLQEIKRDPRDLRIRERIAICYSRLYDPASAELWYSALMDEEGIRPEVMFDFAEVLSTNGKYDQSIRWFREYLERVPGDKVASEKLQFLSDLSLHTINEERFSVSTFDFNSRYAEYGAHFFHRGIVFGSSRDADLLIKRKPVDGVSPDESFLNLYYAERSEVGGWQNLAPFRSKKTETIYHEGPVVFYDQFRKCALTQSNTKNGKPIYDATGKVNLSIHFGWVSPSGQIDHVTPFEYNSAAYSNAHPSFSADGTVMYFTSTMPLGHGASDIFYSTLENGRWTDPVNVGDAVNTRLNESFPFIANDTTLYFSSNGHGGFGGLDLFVSYRRNGKFSSPVNLGHPINSGFDDFSLVCDSLGRSGFIASKELGGMGQDDIYAYTARFYLLAGEVREMNSERQNIAGVRILAFNSNGDLIDSARSDASGRFTLDLPFDQDFIIRGEKDGFETLKGMAFSTRGKPFGVDSLLLPLWKQDLFVKGRIFSNETQAILPGAAVILHDLSQGSRDTLIVQQTGEYEFLVRPDRKYQIEGIKAGFIPKGFNLDTKNLVQGELLNDIVMEEIYIDKETILFEYDKALITDASIKPLNTIVRTLMRFPRATINIGAHSDSRGTHEYNTQLSRRRAESTRDYLLSRGIAASRIQSNWFGEELILNTCSDGVECPEEEHSRNRRAELKVQMEPVE